MKSAFTPIFADKLKLSVKTMPLVPSFAKLLLEWLTRFQIVFALLSFCAFALLGMINWIYQWHRPDGPITEAELVDQFTEIIFAGVFA